MPALRIGARPGYAAAVCAFAVDALYLVLISHQGDAIDGRVVFVAGSLAVGGAAAAAAEGMAGAAGALAAAWAAATLWIWVVLGGFSIGIVVVPAAIFATVALTRRRAPTPTIFAGIVLAFLTAAAGIAWTG